MIEGRGRERTTDGRRKKRGGYRLRKRKSGIERERNMEKKRGRRRFYISPSFPLSLHIFLSFYPTLPFSESRGKRKIGMNSKERNGERKIWRERRKEGEEEGKKERFREWEREKERKGDRCGIPKWDSKFQFEGNWKPFNMIDILD